MTGAEIFAATLKRRGVEWIATLCGHGQDPLYRALTRAAIRLVDTRNEQTAGYIAECYGRLTRRAGVCTVSSGVAHVNGLTGVTNAFFDGAPMLEVAGSGALATMGLGHFQDIDHVAMAKPLTIHARLLDAGNRVEQMTAEALDIAESTPGPVHLTFPMDIQEQEVAESWPARTEERTSHRSDCSPLLELIERSERPLIVAGSGVYYNGEGEAVAATATRLGIPFVVPIWDRGCVEAASPAYLGVIGAATGGPRLLDDADLVILAGAQVDYRLGYMKSLARTVRADYGWTSAALRGEPRHQAWLAEARQRQDAWLARSGSHPVISAIESVMTPETCLVIDGGSIGQWAHQILASKRYPSRWLTCGRSGVVGYGIGGAMAARLAYPKAPVILLSGDGAFTFSPADLECAVRQKLPFVAIVADDQAWGITRVGHERQFGEAISSKLGPIDFVRLAESFGARGVKVESPDQTGPALRRALGSGEVTVLHVPVPGGNPG